MKTIWKYALRDLRDDVQIEMPEGAKPFTVDLQNGDICIWVAVDSEREKVSHTIYVHGTGHPLTGKEGRYFGTVIDVGRFGLVFHFFDQQENGERLIGD